MIWAFLPTLLSELAGTELGHSVAIGIVPVIPLGEVSQ
jgi:hypothetical protein